MSTQPKFPVSSRVVLAGLRLSVTGLEKGFPKTLLACAMEGEAIAYLDLHRANSVLSSDVHTWSRHVC